MLYSPVFPDGLLHSTLAYSSDRKSDEVQWDASESQTKSDGMLYSAAFPDGSLHSAAFPYGSLHSTLAYPFDRKSDEVRRSAVFSNGSLHSSLANPSDQKSNEVRRLVPQHSRPSVWPEVTRSSMDRPTNPCLRADS